MLKRTLLLSAILLSLSVGLLHAQEFQWTDYTATTVSDLNLEVWYPGAWATLETEDEWIAAATEEEISSYQAREPAPESILLHVKWMSLDAMRFAEGGTLEEITALWQNTLELEDLQEDVPYHIMTLPARGLRGVDAAGQQMLAITWRYQNYALVFRLITPDAATLDQYTFDFLSIAQSVTVATEEDALNLSLSNSTEGVNLYMAAPTGWFSAATTHPGQHVFESEADREAFRDDALTAPTGHAIILRDWVFFDWEQLEVTADTTWEQYTALVAAEYGIENPQVVGEHVLVDGEAALMIRGYSEAWNFVDVVILPRVEAEALIAILFSSPDEEAQAEFYPMEIALLKTLMPLE